MYTRTFFPDEQKSSIPENYDGNAFCKANDKDEKAETAASPFSAPAFEEPEEPFQSQKSGSALSALMEKLPIKNLFSFLPLKKGGESAPFHFGTEEILICAAAMYMFFSKSGDKECAIILFLLLFIN